MYKPLLQILSEKQVEVLKSKIWWVADRDKPFLMKFALEEDFMLLQLTDFKSLYVNRFHIKTLIEQKNSFNKPLELKEHKDLLLLFESLLSTSDCDATYLFNELKKDEIQFTFKKRIQIFDFSWTFKLLKVNCNPIELICKEILNPLVVTLEAQARRIELIKKRFVQVEKDYVRKMTQMEKNLYKSPLFEDQQDWKLLLPKFDNKMLHFFKFDDASKFFYKNFVVQQKKQEKVLDPVVIFNDDKKNKAIARVMNNSTFEIAEHQLNRQIERERQKQKKDQKIDFI